MLSVLFLLALSPLVNAVQVKLLVGASNTSYLIDSGVLKFRSEYYSVSLKHQKRKRGYDEHEMMTIRHENIEPDVFQHILFYLEHGVVNAVGEFPILDVLVAADFLQLDKPFYESIVDQLTLKEYIEIFKQLWDNIKSIKTHKQIQISISSGFSESHALELLYDLSYEEYAEIFLSLCDVAIGRRIEAGLDLPDLILREWDKFLADAEMEREYADDRLVALSTMSADFLGGLVNTVSCLTSQQFGNVFTTLRGSLSPGHESFLHRLLDSISGNYAILSDDFVWLDELFHVLLSVEEAAILIFVYSRDESGDNPQWYILVEWVARNNKQLSLGESDEKLFELLERIQVGTMKFTNLECNLEVKPFIRNLVNEKLALKMTQWMFSSVVSRDSVSGTFPQSSSIVPSSHWIGFIDQISELPGNFGLLGWTLKSHSSSSPANLTVNESCLILLQTTDRQFAIVRVKWVLEEGWIVPLASAFLASFETPSSEFDQGITLVEYGNRKMYLENYFGFRSYMDPSNHDFLFAVYLRDGFGDPEQVIYASSSKGMSYGGLFGRNFTTEKVEIYKLDF
jgi:hypothetical protein